MLKPGDPSGSAFLKVDPTYMQHWQQLFPQSQLKNGGITQLQPPDRVAVPVESLRQRPNLISSTSSSFKNDKGSRFKLTSDELDYYLYGQQRMEIIPLNNHTGDHNNRCDMCADNRNGECPMHGPLHSLRRLVGTSSAAPAVPPPDVPDWLRDLPREVCLCTSTVPGLGYGICAAQRIPQGTWIGPFAGVPLLLDKLQSGGVRNTRHLWEEMDISSHDPPVPHPPHLDLPVPFLPVAFLPVAFLPVAFLSIYDQEGTLQHFIDGNEPSKSSWMRYIRCARHCGEQNMMVVQYRPNLNVPTTVMEAMSRQETLQPLSKTGKGFSVALLRSMVFPHSPCSRSFSLMDKGGHTDSGFNQMSSKNQRVLASPTSTSQLSTEFSDWHLWKCGQCFKTFTQRILLQMHVCTQNPDRPYQCGHCSQSFSQPSELRNHVVTHSSDRPFKCGYCGRAFAGATTLNNHIRTHTGEKPFKCERCDRSFTQATQLSRHQRMPNECKPISGESSESIEVD
ncbi:unnamed protein product [Coregonus sp. 'balchen']|nr:unnamed protein product [Coregonus sp. 'balchen']